ncbi:MAG: hypothetical protein HC902_07605 [Calothrix sp. SM1_5_4]|nr:hypothetical protein [Calothrix sp. SM1_5_4]
MTPKTNAELAHSIVEEWCKSIGLTPSTMLMKTFEAALDAKDAEKLAWPSEDEIERAACEMFHVAVRGDGESDASAQARLIVARICFEQGVDWIKSRLAPATSTQLKETGGELKVFTMPSFSDVEKWLKHEFYPQHGRDARLEELHDWLCSQVQDRSAELADYRAALEFFAHNGIRHAREVLEKWKK